MIIKGEKFYDMLDAGEAVKFGVQDVDMVTMESVAIDWLDEDDNTVVTEHVHMVVALLSDGRFVATKPNHDQDFIATIGHKLADMCKKWSDKFYPPENRNLN